MKKKKKKENHWGIWIAIILLTLFIIYLNWEVKNEEQKKFENPLIEILEFEIDSATEYFRIMNITPNCLDYATYYNESLQKYPNLDARWPRYVKICDESICSKDMYHTFIVVGAWNSNCILDNTEYICISREIR